ncbi:putative transcriptional regulator [Cytobacillus eiseniae]|uniref:Transcriptional regulator n=2 Tax=Cytobacillus eiseniae TaxID=762947 RepID=A0ABS4RGS7_9BACI|nr:putative transcriptional regulator [Cytobacillus eiseniae]
MHLPLDEIKRKLELKSKTNMNTGEVEKQVDVVTMHMKQLHNEISVLLPLIHHLDQKQMSDLSKKLNYESSTLIQSLASLNS